MTLISNMAFNEDLPEEFVGSYVFTNPELLPEIFERESVKEEQMHPRGGCPNFEVLPISVNTEQFSNSLPWASS